MEENPIEKKIKDFSNYLMDLGLLNVVCYKDFIKKFKEISENGILSSGNEETDINIGLIYFKDNISKAIVEFYNSMSEERKKIIALNIFSKYNNKKEEEEKNNIIKNDENLDNKKENKKDENIEYKIERMISFNIISKNKVNEKNTNKNDNEDMKINNNIKKIIKNENKNLTALANRRNNSFFSKKPKNCILESKKNVTNENNIKSKNEITSYNNSNCTFQPNIRNIDNLSKYNNNKMKKNLSFDKSNSNVFDRLYKISERKKIEIENIQKELNKENIFQPNNDKKKSKILKRENFDERLKHFEEEKKGKEQKRKEEEQKEFEEKFPFNPKPYNCFNARNKFFKKKININIHQKLYEDNKKLKQKNEERIKQTISEIKDRANHPISIHNNITYLYNNSNIIKNNVKKDKGKKTLSVGKNKDNNNNSNRKNKIYKIDYYEYKNYKNIQKKKNEKENEFKKIEQLYNEYKRMKHEISLKKNIENQKINENEDEKTDIKELNNLNNYEYSYNTFDNIKNKTFENKDLSKEIENKIINSDKN